MVFYKINNREDRLLRAKFKDSYIKWFCGILPRSAWNCVGDFIGSFNQRLVIHVEDATSAKLARFFDGSGQVEPEVNRDIFEAIRPRTPMFRFVSVKLIDHLLPSVQNNGEANDEKGHAMKSAEHTRDLGDVIKFMAFIIICNMPNRSRLQIR